MLTSSEWDAPLRQGTGFAGEPRFGGGEVSQLALPVLGS